MKVWPNAITLGRLAPLLGTGRGSLGVAFPLFRTLHSPAVASHAESDWLQVPVKTGMVGFGLLVVTGVPLAAKLLGLLHAQAYVARIGALAGLVALTVTMTGPTTAGGTLPGQSES